MNYLVIGGSTGIGQALIEQLNTEGHKAISINRSGNTAAEITYAANILTDPLPDIGIPLDGIAYLPGTIMLKPFKALTDEDFLHDWNVNFLGAVKVLRHYLPNLLQSNNTSVVFFSSVAAQTGMGYHSSIAAAKGALEGFTRAMAAELAPKVRVNAIAPSLTLTPLSARFTNNDAKLLAAGERHPLKTLGGAHEIASLAAWLLGTNARFTTGQVFTIDGGLSAIK